MEHTEKSLYEGLKVIKAGARVGDIGHAVQTYAEAHNLGVVRELVGHGVGTKVHEEPDVPNYGKAGTGLSSLCKSYTDPGVPGGGYIRKNPGAGRWQHLRDRGV